MNFGTVALIICIILYIIIAIQNFVQKDYSHSGVWFSYALANIFMLIYELGKIK